MADYGKAQVHVAFEAMGPFVRTHMQVVGKSTGQQECFELLLLHALIDAMAGVPPEVLLLDCWKATKRRWMAFIHMWLSFLSCTQVRGRRSAAHSHLTELTAEDLTHVALALASCELQMQLPVPVGLLLSLGFLTQLIYMYHTKINAFIEWFNHGITNICSPTSHHD